MLHDDEKTLQLLDKYTKKRNVTSPKALGSKRTSLKHSRKRIPKKKVSHPHESSSLLFKLFTGGAILLFIAVGIKYTLDETINHNPLIGKWRTQTELGIMEVAFDPKSMSVFGTTTPVSYDIKGKDVIVFDDDIKIGNTYNVLDHDTISTEAGKHKIIYKRVK